MDEEAIIDFPKDFQSLKKQISLYFKITENIINSIILWYNNSFLSSAPASFNCFSKESLSTLIPIEDNSIEICKGSYHKRISPFNSQSS